jgi:gluconate kinase
MHFGSALLHFVNSKNQKKRDALNQEQHDLQALFVALRVTTAGEKVHPRKYHCVDARLVNTSDTSMDC